MMNDSRVVSSKPAQPGVPWGGRQSWKSACILGEEGN